MEPLEISHSSGLSINGHLTLTVVDADWLTANKHDTAAVLNPPAAVVVDRREGDNVMCAVGLTTIAAAMVWSGIQDQAANLGVTTPTYLTPLYGAVGSGSGTPTVTDVQLFSELGRQVVTSGASTPATGTISAQTTWLFYFASPATNWTVTEAGVFANAFSSANSGSLLDHWAFSPSLTVTTANMLILQASFAIAG
jgi:hypothetical protein